MIKRVPKSLQGVLWSVDVKNLDLLEDRSYIIHQIFSYGRMEEIRWLFRIYPFKTLSQVFTTHPYKDYETARFYFVKNYLLNLRDRELNEKLYVKNIPRDLR